MKPIELHVWEIPALASADDLNIQGQGVERVYYKGIDFDSWEIDDRDATLSLWRRYPIVNSNRVDLGNYRVTIIPFKSYLKVREIMSDDVLQELNLARSAYLEDIEYAAAHVRGHVCPECKLNMEKMDEHDEGCSIGAQEVLAEIQRDINAPNLRGVHVAEFAPGSGQQPVYQEQGYMPPELEDKHSEPSTDLGGLFTHDAIPTIPTFEPTRVMPAVKSAQPIQEEPDRKTSTIVMEKVPTGSLELPNSLMDDHLDDLAKRADERNRQLQDLGDDGHQDHQQYLKEQNAGDPTDA